jgi:hypothetical protein
MSLASLNKVRVIWIKGTVGLLLKEFRDLMNADGCKRKTALEHCHMNTA